MIADYGANAGQQWFDQTFVPFYQKDRPEAKVTMLYTAWADLGQKRDTLYAAGQGPDLVQSGAGQSYAYRKLVVPIDDRVKRWKEWGDYYPSGLASSTWKDKPYGVPAKLDARSMVYRQDLFQKQGLKRIVRRDSCPRQELTAWFPARPRPRGAPRGDLVAQRPERRVCPPGTP